MYVGGVMSDHVLPEMGGPRWIGRNIGLRAPMSTPTQYTDAAHTHSTHHTVTVIAQHSYCHHRWPQHRERRADGQSNKLSAEKSARPGLQFGHIARGPRRRTVKFRPK